MDYPKLVSATPLPDFKLALTFDSGEKKVYDFKPNLNHKYFASLANPKFFEQAKVTNGELEWASGQDFCPHTLYEKSERIANGN